MTTEARDGLGRAISLPVSEDRTVQVKVHLARIRRRHPHADADDWVGLQPSHRAVGSEVDASVTVTGEATRPRDGTQPNRRHRAAGRGPEPADERPELPRPRAAHPGRLAHQLGSTQLFAETSAVPGQGISIASQRNLSNSFIVDGLSANDDAAGLSGIPYGVDAVEQFQVVTSGGQAELGRALGGYVSVVTKSGTNALHGTAYDFIRDDSFNAPNALSGTTLPMNQQQYGGSLGGPVARDRTFYFSNVEQRRSIRPAWSPSCRRTSPIINARLAAAGYPGAPVTTGVYPNPVHSTNVLGEDRSPAQRRRSVHGALQPLRRHVGQLARRGRAQRAERVRRSRQRRPVVWRSATRGRSRRGPSTKRGRSSRYGDLQAPPTDPVGPAVSIAGVASFGTLSGSPDAPVEHDVPGRRQPVAPGRRACAARRRRLSVQRRHHHVPALRPRQLHVLVAGEFSRRHLQRLHADVRRPRGLADQSQRRRVRAGRMAASARGLTLNLGLRYDLQFLRDDRHRHEQPLAARRLRLVAVGIARTVVRGSAGLFFDRVPLRAVANAILSAGNTTDLSSLQPAERRACRPRRPARPRFPHILPAPVPTTTLVDFTTMDPTPAERVLRAGERRGRAAARRARARSASATSTCAATTC